MELPSELGTYVYGLKDPRNGELFYVGRGVGDRCLVHARDALATPVSSDKLDRIRAILEEVTSGPQIMILRRGLPGGACAAEIAGEIEAAIIDVLLHWRVPLTNIVRGAGVERGLRSLESLRAELKPIPLMLNRPAMLVNIDRTWSDNMSDDEVWEAARCWWVARPAERHPRPELLLAVAAKIVRGAWRLPWELSVASVYEHRFVRWGDLDPVRQAIYGSKLEFKEGQRCGFITKIQAPDAADLTGRHVGDLGRSYGGAFRYVP